MYGKIIGPEWGEQSDEFSSSKFYDDNCERLEEIAHRNHPILKRIKKRENKIAWLAETFAAKKTDVEEYGFSHVTLEGLLEEEIEDNGADSEWASELQAAMNWKENADEIEELQKELSKAKIAKRNLGDPRTDEERGSYSENRRKLFEAKSSLESATKRSVCTDEWGRWYENWEKDYNFREEFEAFLLDIVFARRHLREQTWCYNGEIHELAQKYLENPLWYLPQITNFLLVDLIDSYLIMLEGDFQFGLFDPSIANEIGPNTIFTTLLGIFLVSPCLSPKAKAKRRKWRAKMFIIGLSLIYISMGSWEGEKITDPLVNQGFPSWIFTIVESIASFFWGLPPITMLVEYINKRRIRYNSFCKQADNLLNIRWDIYSETYDAKTCIQRLKKLDDQDLHISSLVYPLLELQLNPKQKELSS